MGREVYVRDGVGEEGRPYAVETAKTVVLGQMVEATATATVQPTQANSKVCVGMAFASQARSIYQSDGVTARADATVYATELVSVSQYGEFDLETAVGSGIVPGSPLKAAALGLVALLNLGGGDTADMKVAKAVDVVRTVGTKYYVRAVLTL